MNMADPDDLNGDGSTSASCPCATVEDMPVLDSNTLLVVNDNNVPGGGGRSLLNPVPEPGTDALLLAGLGAPLRRRAAC